jgi:hypothetical protein
MATTNYNRSEVLSVYDLTDEQREEYFATYYSGEENEEFSDCVLFEQKDGKKIALPLSMFMRIDSKIWDGVYGTSYFSAYFIKLSKCGTMAVVAEKFC